MVACTLLIPQFSTSNSIQGCCHSVEPTEGPNSPYSTSSIQGDTSQQPIRGPSRSATEVSNLNTSSHASRATYHGRRRRNIGLQEQFNAPLRPHVWIANKQWTKAELDRERDEFFDTRVTGREEIWATLKSVIGLVAEGDIATAQGILDASAITLPTGDLANGAYDEAGNFYQMPENIIADPTNVILASEDRLVQNEDVDVETDEEVERQRLEKGKGVIKCGELMKVKTRLSDRGGPDVIISIGKEETVRTLIKRIQEEANLTGNSKVKIAYLGRIFKDTESLLAQGWREGHVVNALVFP